MGGWGTPSQWRKRHQPPVLHHPHDLHFPPHSHQRTLSLAISLLGKTESLQNFVKHTASYIVLVGVSVSKDTVEQMGIFPSHFPCLIRSPHFLGDTLKNISFTLPERVGTRAFPAHCTGAHTKNMSCCDSEPMCPLWGRARVLGDSRLTHSCFCPHLTQRSQLPTGPFVVKKHRSTEQTQIHSQKHTYGLESCSLPRCLEGPLPPVLSPVPAPAFPSLAFTYKLL